MKKIGLSIVKIEATEIDDVKIIWPDKFGDHRGFFSETFNSVDASKLEPMIFFSL